MSQIHPSAWKIKTSELSGAALDWAVAIANGIPKKEIRLPTYKGDGLWRWVKDEDGAFTGSYMTGPDLLFSKKWEAGGPIIEREKITIRASFGNPVRWVANTQDMKIHYYIDAPCPLVAAMRCFVASKLGDKVEVPKELL